MKFLSCINVKNILIFIVTLAAILENFICAIFIPSTGAIAQSFQTSVQEAENIFIYYNIGLFLSAPIYGIIGALMGRRPLMILGAAFLLLGCIIPLFNVHLNTFFIARFLQGFGACAAGAVGWAAIQDIFDLKKSAAIMSLMGGVIMAVPLVAPFLGGYIDNRYSWKFIIFITMGISFLYFLIVYLFFPETKITQNSQRKKNFISHVFTQYFLALKTKNFILPVLFFPCMYLCEWAFISFFTFNYYKNGFSNPKYLGLYFSILMIFYALGTIFSNRFLKRKTIDYVIKSSINLMLVISLVRILYDFLFEYNWAVSLVFQSLFLVGSGMLFGPSSSLALKSLTEASISSSLRTTLLMLGGAIGSWLGNIICNFPVYVFSVLTLFFVVAIKILSNLTSKSRMS